MASRSRYSRWDGTQDPFGPDLPASDLLEELADDVLMGDSAERALRGCCAGGCAAGSPGWTRSAAGCGSDATQEEAALNLAGPLEELRERLEEILERERTRVCRSSPPTTRACARRSSTRCRPIFRDSSRELQDYRFTDAEAQREFDELME